MSILPSVVIPFILFIIVEANPLEVSNVIEEGRLRDLSNNERIVGGVEARPGQFPYQVGLFLNRTDRGGWCGGSLVSESYVITAAHCADGIDFAEVYLGAHRIRDLTEAGRVNIIVPRENIFVHENWDSETIANHIALLKLPEKVELTDKIQIIALPTRTDAKIDLEYDYVIASGWGRDANNAAGVSPVLRFATLRVEPQPVCRHFYYDILLPSMVCTTTAHGSGTCNGDSGGPLVRTEGGRRWLVGLTSFGSDIACVVGWPSVFTRITSFLDWIESHSDIKINP